MGAIADSLFALLMGWVRALVDGLWSLVSGDASLLGFLGKHWLLIAVVIIAAGVVIDWLVWLVRWQPYHLWAMRVRRFLHLPDPYEEVSRPLAHTHAPEPEMAFSDLPDASADADNAISDTQWMPLARSDAEQVYAQAEQVSDAELGAYPGMRYDAQGVDARPTADTRHYAAIHRTGRGAAEVERRRAEIDAWQQQMREETQAQAAYAAGQAQQAQAAYEAEQARQAQAAYEAEQARQAQAAYEAEQARQAQAAYEAEQARQAQAAYEAEQARQAQAAYEAEQARQAQAAYEAEQAEYARQLAEYERQKVQYARELAEYERQKAAYDAYIAQQSGQPVPDAQTDMKQTRRRRAVSATYSDYVAGETVDTLPDPPQWPQLRHQTPSAAPQTETKEKSGLIHRMAQMIEPEDEELSRRTTLPPRVDMRDAYKPATPPPKGGKRSR